MSLRAPVVAFMRAYDGLGEVCTSYGWGTLTRNPSLPHVHDANRPWIYDAETPSLGELREAMAAAQRTVPVAFTHVEVVDLDVREELTRGLTQWLGSPPDRFVVMTLRGQPQSLHAAVTPIKVDEEPFPDDHARWLALVEAGHYADEGTLPTDVLRELVARDTGQLRRAGTRLFCARINGEIAGYASLLSLDGVGLVDNVATVPALRRRGVASAVVHRVLAASSAAHNAHTVLFTHEDSNAQRIYERLGMTVVARGAQFRRDEPLVLAGAG